MKFSDTVMSWIFDDESGIDHAATTAAAQRIAGEIVKQAQAEGQSISDARTAFVYWYVEVVQAGKISEEQFPAAREIADKVDTILRKGRL